MDYSKLKPVSKPFDLDYDTLLNDSRWIEKRNYVKRKDGHTCRYCNAKKDLHVHHVFYILNKMPWDYPINYLVTLCGNCHKHWHELYGVEYASEDGRLLTLFLVKNKPVVQLEDNRYYEIPFELRDSKNEIVYEGRALTWDIEAIESDMNGTPLNHYLSHKDHGAWLVPTKFCDGYNFKFQIFKQLNIKDI